MLLLLALACPTPDDPRFPTGGDPSLPDTNETGQQTDDTSVSDDTGEVVDPTAPVIKEAQVGWCIDVIQGQQDDYIAVYIDFSDDEDIQGGRVLLDFNTDPMIGSDNKEGQEIDNNANPLLAFVVDGGSKDGQIFMSVTPPETIAYNIRVRLRDTAGNVSEAVTIDLAKNDEMPEELCTANSGA